MQGVKYRVKGVKDLGFKRWFGVQGVQGLELRRVRVLDIGGLGFMVQGLLFRAQGS